MLLAWLAVVAVLWSGDGAMPCAAAPTARADAGRAGASRPPHWAGAAAAVSVDGQPTDPQPVVRHPYLYTTLEIALVLAGGTVWYLRNGTDDERWDRGVRVACLEAKDARGRRHVRRRPLQHERDRPPDGRHRLLPDRARQRVGTGGCRSLLRSSAPRSGSTSSSFPNTRRSTT